MNTEKKIAILGGGSWATAIAKMLLNNTESLNWFMRNEESIKYIKENGRNPRYLTGAELDKDKINLYSDINEAIENSDILIFAIPAAFLKLALSKLKVDIKDKFVVSAIKGIIPDDNMIVGEFFQKIYNVPENSIGVIAGPCHAEVDSLGCNPALRHQRPGHVRPGVLDELCG